MSVGRRVVYSGRVQGVGFRFTAQRLAAGFPITGYVRNLPSGDVELVAEGAVGDLDAFLEALGSALVSNIGATVVAPREPSGLTGFTIRY